MMYGGLVAPGGGRWALANGAELEAAAYPEVYAILGTRFVVGTPAAGRFNLPNLADRVPVGAGASTAVGATGGSRDAVVPTHSHVMDHAHAGTTSGNDSPDHAHGGIDHLHSVDIWSSYTDVNHYHGGLDGQNTIMHLFGQGQSVDAFDGGTQFIFGGGTTHWSAQDLNHRHAINGMTGAADRPLTTHGANARHQHSTSTPAMTGRTGTEGVAVANANLPPYLGVQHIIRIT